ncbi:MAG: Bax inhibitor-1/YccA family protein [Elusimicrobiaceae bacterium]|jgi:uncharacterized YccA/Bax inhibitor family protein|nr:Bax inhibitor-1/YccA family protein [Elusimicrobiaceae bacterium]MBT4007843.1 Bax inhibitor-1/YccA family protein [Elusimicrobiaceae bacterium]MBT6715076.1 Bax inhibitor-1/YccA family protein [Elusimicrobiaceae bacterium]
MFRTSNPSLSEKIYQNQQTADTSKVMTVQGTMNKTFILLFICVVGAMMVWSNAQALAWLMFPALIGGFILAMIIIFKPAIAPILSPVYAFVEGLLIGVLSAYFEKQFPGIVIQAVSLTMVVFLGMLFVYKARIIKVTGTFRKGVMAATLGIALFYLASLVGGLFGFNMPLIHSSGTFGILFSLFVCTIAALNFALSFDFIERASNSYQVPKYMEWYSAFGLLVTLIWLYLEILRLLSKLRGR